MTEAPRRDVKSKYLVQDNNVWLNVEQLREHLMLAAKEQIDQLVTNIRKNDTRSKLSSMFACFETRLATVKNLYCNATTGKTVLANLDDGFILPTNVKLRKDKPVCKIRGAHVYIDNSLADNVWLVELEKGIDRDPSFDGTKFTLLEL